MSAKAISSSGTSESPLVPALLPYDVPPGLAAVPELMGKLVYVQRLWRAPGPSLLIYRDPARDLLALRCGDWEGTTLEPAGQMLSYLNKHGASLLRLCKAVRLCQVQLYLSDDLRLVDARVSLNKFCGPGMLKDLFGPVVPVLETIAIEPLDERVFGAIEGGVGTYSGDLLVKPSKYQHREAAPGVYAPLHAMVRR